MSKKPDHPVDASEKKLRGLRTFNLVMGFLHLIQGVLMLVITFKLDKTYPIFTNYLKFDVATLSLVTDPKLAYELNFGLGVALFLLLSAVAHFSLATFGYKWYVANLKKGMNPARFYEYALSSSLMIVLIGMLVGINDLAAVILIFGLNAMMNLFGIMMEKHNQLTSKTDWTSFIYGVSPASSRGWPSCGTSWEPSTQVQRISLRRSSTPSSRPYSSFSISLL